MPERKTSISQAAELLTQPFSHTVLGQVDGYCVYVSRFLGGYRFHRHDRDEMYMVVQGEAFIDYYDGPSVPIGEGESLVVKAGELHRSRSEKDSLVLLFKAADLFAE